MKDFFLFVILIFCLNAVQAQINLEYSYPNTQTNEFTIVKLGYAGDKYVSVDLYFTQQILIYNLNQVLEKTISIPAAALSDYSQVYYVSDNLFDTDSRIEYLVNKPLPPNSAFSSTYIVKEDGTIILQVDSAGHANYQNPNLISEFTDIFPTSSGTKLILKKPGYGFLVYSLPGSLPCYECTDGGFTGNITGPVENENRSSLSNPFPNPTNNLTRIDYQLPGGIRQGELIFYNTYGMEVKRFKVTDVFSFINVSAQDLLPGTYYFTLQTSEGLSDGKKMVVIR